MRRHYTKLDSDSAFAATLGAIDAMIAKSGIDVASLPIEAPEQSERETYEELPDRVVHRAGMIALSFPDAPDDRFEGTMQQANDVAWVYGCTTRTDLATSVEWACPPQAGEPTKPPPDLTAR